MQRIKNLRYITYMWAPHVWGRQTPPLPQRGMLHERMSCLHKDKSRKRMFRNSLHGHMTKSRPSIGWNPASLIGQRSLAIFGRTYHHNLFERSFEINYIHWKEDKKFYSLTYMHMHALAHTTVSTMYTDMQTLTLANTKKRHARMFTHEYVHILLKK